MPDVLCVGAVNHDTIALVERLPGHDERMVADRIEVGYGGPVATAAVTLARLGHRVAISASVGDDPEGEQVIAGLEAEGVDVALMVRRPGERTARSVIIVDAATHGRAIVTSPYRSRPEHVPLDIAPIVHVDQAGYAAARAALDVTPVSSRPRLSVDGGNPVDGIRFDGIWLYAPTVAMLRSHFGDGDLPQLLACARAAGAGTVVASDGPRGSGWLGDGAEAYAPAFAVEVVSTLGAGDVFHGALLSAILDARSPADSLRWANACAALSCRALDGRSGIPNRDELQAFLTARPETTEHP
jgi:sulfofructose kinase